MYDGMLVHSFDIFYVVTKFILSSIGDLNFLKLNYDNTCAYLYDRNTHDADTKKYLLDLLAFCKKLIHICLIIKGKLSHINNTAHNILRNETDLILPTNN